MKKFFESKLVCAIRFLTVIAVLMISIGLVSCNNNEAPDNTGGATPPSDFVGITFNTLSVNGNNVYEKVSNKTESFSFIDEISAVGGAKYIVSLDITGSQPVQSKTINLEIGDNTVYIIEMVDDEPTNIYTVTIRRRPIYTVTFDSNGGTAVNSISVEEDKLIPSEPSITRVGYTFVSWDYDFSKPITKDIYISSEWNANTNTAYKVEYYLQNLARNGFDLVDTLNLTGTTDTTATAEQKIFEHFTFNSAKSVMSGNIDGDGSRVLKVYYTRNSYTVSSNNTSAGSVTNTGSYAYDKEFTLIATANLGYKFIGWYSEDKLLSTNVEYTTAIDRNIEARFEVLSEMQNFNFTSTATTCTIRGIKDKTVTEIVIPDSVTHIGDSAFYGCTSLTSITIPDSVTSIYREAFRNCTSLSSAIINASIIGEYAFYGCTSLESITIGNKVKQINRYAFCDCSSLESITIPTGITHIGIGAFYGCTSLANITIPNSVTHIGESAFRDCTSLTSVSIPNSVTSIGDYAFRDCTKLKSVTIPETVTSIGNSAFLGCSNLVNITFEGTAAEWNAISFGTNWRYNVPATEVICSDWKSELHVSMGLAYSVNKDGTSCTITGIGSCSDRDLIIPSQIIGYTVTVIGDSAFENCTNLESVTIPNSVTSIGSSAFRNCTSLTRITIGIGVTRISSYAFYNCKILTNITFKGSAYQWGKIALETQWNYNVPASLVSCSGLTFTKI